MGNKEFFGEPTRIEVQDADLSNVVVKVTRGSIISGVVVIEDVNDAAVKSKLQQMSLMLDVKRRLEQPNTDRRSWNDEPASSKIAVDGSFLLSGAPPGIASFYVWGGRENLFWIKRIERDGSEVRNNFEIKQGERISGVRVVCVYASGTVRGQVEIGGGRMPEDWQLSVQATSIAAAENKDMTPAFHRFPFFARVDEKGRFMIERIVPGEYDLELKAYVRLGQNEWKSPPDFVDIKQRIVVNSGAETQVKFTFNPNRK
jgi:hypothetical protein